MTQLYPYMHFLKYSIPLWFMVIEYRILNIVHYALHSTSFNVHTPFNFQNSPIKEMLLLSPFYKGETWEQSEVTSLSSAVEVVLTLRHLAAMPVLSVARLCCQT